jgi:uncharacterized 2Fe-2S/4Fe-4S cluster protein (DUF4445 family)
MTAEDLVREFMAVLDAARETANRSVLNGTVSCGTCRALVLESNSETHAAWHRLHLQQHENHYAGRTQGGAL